MIKKLLSIITTAVLTFTMTNASLFALDSDNKFNELTSVSLIDTVDLQAEKNVVTVTLSTDKEKYELNENIVFTITVPEATDGMVRLYYKTGAPQDDPVGRNMIEDGKSEFEISLPDSGTHTFYAIYSESETIEDAQSNEISIIVADDFEEETGSAKISEETISEENNETEATFSDKTEKTETEESVEPQTEETIDKQPGKSQKINTTLILVIAIMSFFGIAIALTLFSKKSKK